MNHEDYRKRIELKGELSRIESKYNELQLLLKKDYFAECKIEGRTTTNFEEVDEIRARYRNPSEVLLQQTLFENTSYSLWNDLCRKFIRDMGELLEIRKFEIEDLLKTA